MCVCVCVCVCVYVCVCGFNVNTAIFCHAGQLHIFVFVLKVVDKALRAGETIFPLRVGA